MNPIVRPHARTPVACFTALRVAGVTHPACPSPPRTADDCGRVETTVSAPAFSFYQPQSLERR